MLHAIRATVLCLLLAVTLGASPSAAQTMWAAAEPDSERRLHFGWGPTEEIASGAAKAACKRVSQTCAGDPAVTDDPKIILAFMCCASPRLGCATSGAHTREEAQANVDQLFKKAGFSRCTLNGYYSVRTGQKQ